MSIQQHQQKSLLKFYVLPRAKKEPLSRKILGKAVQNAVGKGTGPSNLPDTAVGIFLSRLKKWAQKSPEVVETSRLFAAASFLVQLDGGAAHAISEHESVAVFCPEILKVKTILRPFSPSS